MWQMWLDTVVLQPFWKSALRKFIPGVKLEDDGVQKSEAGERVRTLPYTTYPRKLERYLLKINGTGR